MLGTLVNTAAVITGAVLGLLLKKGLSEKMADTLMKGLGLCTMYLGLRGSLEGENSLILILSLVLGTLVGEGIDLEERLKRLGAWLETRLQSKEMNKVSVAEGFVTSSLLFCVGALAIVGSLQSGLLNNHEVLFNKSVLDFVASVIFASALGVGVVFSGFLVLFYQGSITILAQWVSPFLSDTVINEMTCVGSVILIGLALNMLGVTKLKIMNYVPSIFLPVILSLFL